MAHWEYLAEVKGRPDLTTTFDTKEWAEAYAITHSVWVGRDYRVTQVLIGDPMTHALAISEGKRCGCEGTGSKFWQDCPGD